MYVTKEIKQVVGMQSVWSILKDYRHHGEGLVHPNRGIRPRI